jgi:hypothetical protein
MIKKDSKNHIYHITPKGRSSYSQMLKKYKMDFSSVQSKRAYFLQDAYRKNKRLLGIYESSDFLEDDQLRFFQYLEKFEEHNLDKYFDFKDLFYKVVLFIAMNHPYDEAPSSIKSFCLEHHLDELLFRRRLAYLVHNKSLKVYEINFPKSKLSFYFLEGLYLDQLLKVVIKNFFEREFIEYVFDEVKFHRYSDVSYAEYSNAFINAMLERDYSDKDYMKEDIEDIIFDTFKLLPEKVKRSGFLNGYIKNLISGDKLVVNKHRKFFKAETLLPFIETQAEVKRIEIIFNKGKTTVKKYR